jgi:hypothetical protein
MLLVVHLTCSDIGYQLARLLRSCIRPVPRGVCVLLRVVKVAKLNFMITTNTLRDPEVLIIL